MATLQECIDRWHAARARRWARDFDRCQECGTTESAHNARGLCGRCSARARYRALKAAGLPAWHANAPRPLIDGQLLCRRCDAPVEPGKQCLPCRERAGRRRREGLGS